MRCHRLFEYSLVRFLSLELTQPAKIAGDMTSSTEIHQLQTKESLSYLIQQLSVQQIK